MGKMKNNILWAIAGGAAFWLPAVTLSAIFRWNVGMIALNVASLVGLAVLALAWRIWDKVGPRWGWVLVGIYVLGPAAMLVAAEFSRLPNSVTLPGDWVWWVVFCFLPPMTLWMATLNGMIFSVLLATGVLPILARHQHK